MDGELENNEVIRLSDVQNTLHQLVRAGFMSYDLNQLDKTNWMTDYEIGCRSPSGTMEKTSPEKISNGGVRRFFLIELPHQEVNTGHRDAPRRGMS